jgi:hypothetical protein
MPFRATVASRRRTEVVAEELPGVWDDTNKLIATTPSGVIYVVRGNYEWVGQEVAIWSETTQIYTFVAGNRNSNTYTDGTGANAAFGNINWCFVWNEFMNAIVFEDSLRIRVLTPNGVVTTLAGDGYIPPGGAYNWIGIPTFDGTGSGARFGVMTTMSIVPSNGNIVVAEFGQRTIRIITPLGVVTTLAGPGSELDPLPEPVDGTGSAARFTDIRGLAVFPSSGVIAVLDLFSIRLVSPAGVVTTLSLGNGYGYTDGPSTISQFGEIIRRTSMCILAKSEHIIIADGDNYSVRMITKDGFMTTLAGSSVPWSVPGGLGPYYFSVISDKQFLAIDGMAKIMKVTIV